MFNREVETVLDAQGRVVSVRVPLSLMDGKAAPPADSITTEQVIAATRAVMAEDAAVAARDAYLADLTAGGTYAPAPHSLPIVTDQELADAAATAKAARDAYLAELRGDAT